MTFHLIGELYGKRSDSMDYDIQHCLLKCHRRAVPLCQTQQMESNHLEGICPLRKARRDRLNRSYRNTRLLRTIIPFCGICLTTLGILILLLWCRSSLTRQFLQLVSNPLNYPNNEIPVLVMAQDFLTTYKYGWKTSYYQNTYDVKEDEDKEEEKK